VEVIPSCSQNPLTSAIASKEPRERLGFWQGILCALDDRHSRTELRAMAEFELSHLRREMNLKEVHLPNLNREDNL
jgi:hypothetical protein